MIIKCSYGASIRGGKRPRVAVEIAPDKMQSIKALDYVFAVVLLIGPMMVCGRNRGFSGHATVAGSQCPVDSD